MESNEAALAAIVEAIQAAGYKPGEDLVLALDVAATEIYSDGNTIWPGKGVASPPGVVEFYRDLVEKYIISIEDGMAEEDWDAGSPSTRLWVTRFNWWETCLRRNVRRPKGIELGAADFHLIKLNQIGTVTSLAAIEMAKRAGYTDYLPSLRRSRTPSSPTWLWLPAPANKDRRPPHRSGGVTNSCASRRSWTELPPGQGEPL